MFQGHSHTMLFVENLDRAVNWYREKLDFEVDYHAPGAYASLSHEAVGRLALHPTSNPSKHIGVGPMPYFQASDVKATLAALEARSVKVGEARREGESPWFAEFYDSEGNILGIEQE